MIERFKWIVRRVLNCFFDTLWTLRAAEWPARAEIPATLIISPHPDDDVFACAALMLSRKAGGQIVHVLYLTDGSASHPGHPALSPESLALQRLHETQEAARCLGLEREDLHYLGLRDGTLQDLGRQEKTQLAEKLAHLIGAHSYDEVFIPLRCDGSSEHEAAFQMIRPLVPGTIHLYEYPVWARWSAWRLRHLLGRSVCRYCLHTVDSRNRKAGAIRSHKSQLEPCPPWTRPVLPEGFASLFSLDHEFFFPSHESDRSH
jgi:LmbE family N-acetylglucosaminyl deacetylase